MADNDDDRPQRFKALQDLVRSQTRQLTSDQGVPGTDISIWRLPDLAKSYANFQVQCMRQLQSSNSCSGIFNVAGKRLEVEVNLPKLDPTADRVSIQIINEETQAQRRAIFSPRNTNGL